MYQIKELKPQDIEKIKVKSQAQIIDLIGYELDPKKAFEVIKHDSKNFTNKNEDAIEADGLFMKLLTKNGIVLEGQTKPTKGIKSIQRIKEQERARALELLELELQLAA